MNKFKIERLTTSIAITFFGVLILGIIFLLADTIFGWDIFSTQVEKALGFILASLAVIIFSSVIINVMINISIIAEKIHGK